MATPLLHRTFAVTVAWTLGLLLLGSVVHATESSLACPDWPTCFGTMMPEMVGGVFWEHLHRLVAGGLILLFGAATWLAWRARARPWIVKASAAGVVLLLVQAVFGGLTVLWRLPDAVSTTHLGLAFLFLGLATVLAAATSPRREERPRLGAGPRRLLTIGGATASGLVFVQSLLGAYVRHADAGMACGRGVLCNGGLVPPAFNHLIGIHYLHRVVGVVTALVVLGLAVALVRRTSADFVRRMAWTTAALVAAQVALGFLGAYTALAVVPVSLHTLGAAGLLSATVLLATWGRLDRSPREDPRAAAAAARAA
ncbi:MAG TPA: COX15/CtaA family protein, partial [Longimicrobiales bacterium]|nr:COX15/CtaA family protein [Longimicrobiales bacterium]